jgi:hypothetical protein
VKVERTRPLLVERAEDSEVGVEDDGGECEEKEGGAVVVKREGEEEEDMK